MRSFIRGIVEMRGLRMLNFLNYQFGENRYSRSLNFSEIFIIILASV